MKKQVILFLILILSLVMGAEKSIKQHPFTVHDLLAMDRISDIQLAPDGKQLVFVIRKTDLAANRSITDLWIIDSSGKNLKQLTNDKAADYNPRWSKDSQYVWFLSTRSGSSQVWKISTKGEATQETDLPLNCGNLVMAPDGQKIAFSLDVFPRLSVADTRKKLDKIKKRKASGRIFDRLFIRHWDSWQDGRRSHVFVKDLKKGTVVDVMQGMDTDSPLKPFGGPEEVSFTPDSKSIIFTAANSGKKEAWSTNHDLFIAPADGSGKAESITVDNKAWDSSPAFSPDGKTLAYLAMKRPGFEADRFYIILMDWKTKKKKVLARDWDRSAGPVVWGKKSKYIYVVASDLGQRSLFKIKVSQGKVERLFKHGYVRSLNVGAGKVFFGKDTLAGPVEIYSAKQNGKKIKQITRINSKQLEAAAMGEYRQFTFKGWNNETVYGYIVKPVDFDPGKKYPVAFLIHGGPQGSFGNDFHYRWNPQVYAGAGFAAVMIDFHGSTGYGQAFTDSITGDWGGKPLIDLQKGLKAALALSPWMDGKRVVALGASYGGYMVNWIAGNWPERFRCLVNHDGNLDERMAYYDTEELWFPEWEHKGTPWDNPGGYEKHNPVNFVKNWKTPMLVIHGALDFRVVETQGFSTFTALQRKGIPSRLLYFPDENHWVLKPHNSILWHKTVIDWIKHWIR